MYPWPKNFSIVVCLALAITSCGLFGTDDASRGENDVAPAVVGNTVSGGGNLAVSTDPNAPAISLKATAAPARVGANPLVEVVGVDLDPEQIEAARSLLPAWEPPVGETEFRRPSNSLRPPTSGIVDGPSFGEPSSNRPASEPADLEVVRVQPEGPVDLAPFITISFNQAMVPLSTLSQLDRIDVPVVISPPLEGRWEWLGTKVLRFQHDPAGLDRLPMATEYLVTIPSDMTSANGTSLSQPKTFQFSTPPPSVVAVQPQHDHVTPTQVFMVRFTSPIEPDAIAEVATIDARGGSFPVRVATADEIADSGLIGSAEDRPPEVAYLRPVDPLPLDSDLSIVIGPDVPSPEGTLTNPDTSANRARTYGPLQIRQSGCGRCTPGSSLGIEFSNPLDPAITTEDLINLSPAIEGVRVEINGRYVRIGGLTAPTTDYTFEISAEATDIYGQKLTGPSTRTITIGEAEPRLFGLTELSTADPFADSPSLEVFTTNHDQLRVRMWTVDAGQFVQYRDWAQSLRRFNEVPGEPPGDPVVDSIIETTTEANLPGSTLVGLGEAIDGEFGHVIVRVDPVGALAELSRDDQLWWQNQPTVSWVQVTRIGLDSIADEDSLHVWATDLRSGEPLTEVAIRSGTSTSTAVETDANGLASGPWGSVGQLTARQGNDVALLTNVGWRSNSPRDEVRWHVLDDRGVYRPGETASIKGWLRIHDDDAQLVRVDRDAINWRVHDAFGIELETGTADLSEEGGFSFSVTLPEGANLGNAWVELSVSGFGAHNHSFDVQEFRRPEFEVTTEVLSTEPIVAGDKLELLAEASYFSGGALPDAPIRWEVRSRPATYKPPGWSEYSFSNRVIDWWFFDDFGGRGGFDSGSFGPGGFEPESEFAELNDVLNADGRHALRVDLGEIGSSPVALSSEAAVTDVNGQRWPASSDVIVHPGDVYVGLKTVVSYGQRGDDAVVDVVATSIEGEARSGVEVTVTMGRLVRERVDGQFTEIMVDSMVCEITSSSEPETCTFAPEIAGRYRIQSSVTDASGRLQESALTYWVSGGPTVGAQRVALDQAQVIPDAKSYEPGSTAEVLVVSPFSPAHGQVVTTRNGIQSIEPILIEDFSATVRVPITSQDVPNLDVQVELVGATERTDRLGNQIGGAPSRPAFATGRTRLAISPEGRRLEVNAQPAVPEVTPGSKTTIDLRITDQEGKPVSDAEAAVIVVDEAVLAVSQYEVVDPIETFYQPFSTWLQVRRGRSQVLLSSPEIQPEAEGALAEAIGDDAVPAAASFSADAGGRALSASADLTGSAKAIEVRKDFAALAAFEPDVVTDADGRATINVDLPDSLTRYRVIVVTAEGDSQFGTGESSITATLPLTVRPATPRFANFGDEFRFAAVVQNTTSADITAEVVVDTGNLAIDGTSGRRVTVPANNRILVPFSAEADEAGIAHYRVAVIADGTADAAQASFPVYTPATSEAFATYGEIEDGAIRIPIDQPKDVYPQFGGLEVQTSATILQSLTDAVLYLDSYEYESADRYSSRILGLLALADVLREFDVEGLQTEAQIDRAINRDIKALLLLQQPGEGVFRSHPTARQPSPYQTVLATHALVLADKAGYPVNPAALAQAVDVMNWIEQYQFGDWSPRVGLGLQAYATHVLELAGRKNTEKAVSVMDQLLSIEGTAVDSLALLWPSLRDDAARSAEIQRRIRNAAVDQAGTVTFATGYTQDDYYLYPSTLKSDAIVVAALLREDPSSDLIAKAVRGINAGRTNGRWTNVQENAFVLLALRSYFDTFEATDPDFVVRTWLGDEYASEGSFRSRSTDIQTTELPMSEVLIATEGVDPAVVVAKEGAGRLYYRLGLTYAPTDLTLDPLDRGFIVSRTYSSLDDEGSVERNQTGEWVIAAGTTVKVEVTMVADARRTHVALVDPLAAGLEPRSPLFRDPIGGDAGRWWWWNWYQHTNLRDDRAEAFTSYLSAGTYTFTYLVEAVTPGTYVVPPAKAEEVYTPETFGRSGSDILIVE